MSVYDNTPALPTTKSDSHPANSPANQSLPAAEFNNLVQAVADLRTGLQSVNPTAGNVVAATVTSNVVNKVATIAALRNAPIANSPVIVQGATVAGDGGGGVFHWDTSGVYLLDDNVGIVITSSLSGAGRWRREGFVHFRSGGIVNPTQDVNPAYDGVNVKWFGAKGDGSTDDAAAIQNAVNAALQISQNLAQLPANGGYLGLYSAIVRVMLPAGVYHVTGAVNGNTGIDVPAGVSLYGVGHAVIQSTNNTINLIRIQAWGNIENIVFRGGKHSIALFGVHSITHQVYDPTAFGNVPIVIKGCRFVYPTGPAIWQDPGSSTTVAVGSNNVALPTGTINVASTADFTNLPSGSIVVLLQNGTAQTVTYTGITPTSFTGCSGGTGTIHTGDAILVPTLWRSFQSTLRVLEFQFEGPHLFWGVGDSVIFQHGHISWDFSTPELSSDGLPLGLFNSADTVWVDHVSAFGGGTQLPRQAMFVGSGSMKISATDWGQNDFMCFVRQRTRANRYAMPNGALVPMPADLSALTPIDLDIDHIGLISAYGAYWLEVYETFPAAIKLKNWQESDFTNSLGIWIDSGVSLTELLGRHTAQGSIEFSGFKDWGGYFRFFQGADPGASILPSTAQTTEVTDVFTLYRIEETKPGESASLPNLFGTATADAAALAFGLTSNTQTPESSSGYSVSFCTATNPALDLSMALQTTGTTWFSSGQPAGIYCFSFYLKANFSGFQWFTIAPSPNGGVTQAVRKFEATDSWQRIWVPFYYPGNNTSMYLSVVDNAVPRMITTWTAGATYAAKQRVTNGGNVYLCIVGGTAAGSGGPSGTGNSIIDNTVTWNYVSPGGTFTPTVSMGLMMVNKGRHPAPYVFPGNNDANTNFRWIPRVYYGSAIPTTGSYVVGDRMFNTVPVAGGVIGWVCTTAGTPGTWKSFGAIAP